MSGRCGLPSVLVVDRRSGYMFPTWVWSPLSSSVSTVTAATQRSDPNGQDTVSFLWMVSFRLGVSLSAFCSALRHDSGPMPDPLGVTHGRQRTSTASRNEPLDGRVGTRGRTTTPQSKPQLLETTWTDANWILGRHAGRMRQAAQQHWVYIADHC